MPKTCLVPPRGDALWRRVERLLARHDRDGQELVSRITSAAELQVLLAKQLGHPHQPGELPVCPAWGDGLLVGYPLAPRALLHRTPAGEIHIAGDLASGLDLGAAIEGIVEAMEANSAYGSRR